MSHQKFVEYQNQVISLASREKYNATLDLISNIEKEFPSRLDKINFWRACIYTLQGDH